MSGRKRVPLLPGGMLAGGEPLSLLRNDVNESRAAHFPNSRKRVHQRVHVMAIDWAEVTEAQLFEQHAWREEGFHTLLPPPHDRSHGTYRVNDLAELGPHAIVEWVPLNGREILVHRAHVRRDGHLIVIQHHDKVALGMAGVVQPLVGEATAQRAVAENGDDFEVLLADDVARRGHAERRRDRRARVSRAKGVVLALRALQKA